ncbi:MAG: hypothetical protein M3T49_07410 [Candidatus Eremiobacteraeota bacterium]|nr:hypothetical protein [Candidatus Eremiobacteraeota bacterium]
MFARSVPIVVALWIALGAPAAQSAGTAPPTQSGVFVALGADANGAQLTLQQGDALKTLVLGSKATARERAVGGAWKDLALSGLEPGEPVSITLGPKSAIARVDAQYVPVVTRLVALEDGYAITTSGKAYKLVGGAASSAQGLQLGAYLLLRADLEERTAFSLRASRSPFLDNGAPAQAVAMTFVVTVPVNTPAADAVYLATNARGWTPNAVRMTPLGANRWTTTLALTAGTQVEYKYTRGSWSTDERNASGGDIPNRSLTTGSSAHAQTVSDTVARWADLSS